MVPIIARSELLEHSLNLRLAVYTGGHGWLTLPDWLVTMGTVPMTASVTSLHNFHLSWVGLRKFRRIKYPNYLSQPLDGILQDLLDALQAHSENIKGWTVTSVIKSDKKLPVRNARMSFTLKLNQQ